jgi:hypothetical protein
MDKGVETAAGTLSFIVSAGLRFENAMPTFVSLVIARPDRAIQGPCDKRLVRGPLDHRVKPDGDDFFVIPAHAMLNRTAVGQARA